MTIDVAPPRVHFAAGDFLTRYPHGAEFRLRIDTPRLKRNWTPRVIEPNKPVFPGSTVMFEDRPYEVVSITTEQMQGLNRYCYYLNPWEDRFPIRVQFHYTQQACLDAVRQARQEARNVNYTAAVMLLAPIMGMLPEPDQKRIGNYFGISPLRFTFLSALVLFFPGAFCFVLLMVAAFSPAARFYPTGVLMAGSYFLLESLLRLYSSMSAEEPMGSILLSFPVELIRAVRRNVDPKYRQARFEKMVIPHRSNNAFSNARDEVKEVQGQEHDLEIISLLPKPDWTLMTGVHYNGSWYGPVEFEKIREGDKVKHRILLKKAPEHFVFRTTCVYTPEDVRMLYQQIRRRDLSTWVETFSIFWGLLDGKDQKRLQELYNFDALKYTRWTFLALGLLALINIIASIANLASGIATRADTLLLLPYGYLLLESYTRRKDWKSGEPSGSILGLLFRPFALRLLKE